MNDKKRVLLTGATGFVGSHIVEGLLKGTNWEIVTLDRLSRTAKNGYDRLRDIDAFDNKRVFRFQHDLNMPIGEGLRKEIGHIDYVLHVASESHVDRSITDPVPFCLNNVNITLMMLEFARDKKADGDAVEKFLYFSTDEVYGTAPEGIFYKEGDRFNAGNPYAASKAAAECFVTAYANTYKLPCIITNTMNIIGERQDPEKYFPLVINKLLDGEKLFIHADPTKTKAGKRHYLHARNITAALIFIFEQTTEVLDPEDASLGRFNIVGEREYDNEEFALAIADEVKKLRPEVSDLDYELVDFHSSRPGHDMRYGLSGDKLKSIGFVYPVTVEESIRRVVEWTLREDNKKWLGRN